MDRVENTVAFSVRGAVQEGAAQKAFSVGRKDDIDGVVHACRNDGFEVGAVRTHAKEVRCLADKGASIAERVALFGVGAFGPVDEAMYALLEAYFAAAMVICTDGVERQARALKALVSLERAIFLSV